MDRTAMQLQYHQTIFGAGTLVEVSGIRHTQMLLGTIVSKGLVASAWKYPEKMMNVDQLKIYISF